MVIERLDGPYNERNEAGQYPLYNTVGCVVVKGNEDGGEHHAYTQRTRRWMAHNAVHIARILRSTPIPAEGNTFDEESHHPAHNG
jgi:multimeric flavodoxin WrbA